MKRPVGCAALAAGMAAASPAHATLLDFAITGDSHLSFQLAATPDPSMSARGIGFFAAPMAESVDAITTTTLVSSGMTRIFFLSERQGGGLHFLGGVGSLIFDANGPQLYAGREDSPIFSTGGYALTSVNGKGRYSLFVSPVLAVPEPESWALMIAGMGLAGGVLRGRKRKAKAGMTTAACT